MWNGLEGCGDSGWGTVGGRGGEGEKKQQVLQRFDVALQLNHIP